MDFVFFKTKNDYNKKIVNGCYSYLLKCNYDEADKNVDHKEGNDDNVYHIKNCHVWTTIWNPSTFTLCCD